MAFGKNNMESKNTLARESIPKAVQTDRRMNPLLAALILLAIQILYSIGSLLLILTSNSKSGILPSFVLLQLMIFWVASRLSISTKTFVTVWIIGAISFGVLHLPWLFR
jgi:VIT1/CCC1 family predicted Fe2+/Mn2+ transporter